MANNSIQGLWISYISTCEINSLSIMVIKGNLLMATSFRDPF